jgi:hypothetical protein
LVAVAGVDTGKIDRPDLDDFWPNERQPVTNCRESAPHLNFVDHFSISGSFIWSVVCV